MLPSAFLPDVKGSHNFNETHARPFTSEDIRFTKKGDLLYFLALGWPDNGSLLVKSLAKGNDLQPKMIKGVEMLGNGGRLSFQLASAGLEVKLLPAT